MFAIKYSYDGDVFYTECEDEEKAKVIKELQSSRVYGHHYIKPAHIISIQHYDGTIEDNQYWR